MLLYYNSWLRKKYLFSESKTANKSCLDASVHSTYQSDNNLLGNFLAFDWWKCFYLLRFDRPRIILAQFCNKNVICFNDILK